MFHRWGRGPIWGPNTHMFVIWRCIIIKGEVSREYNWFKPPPPSLPSNFPPDCSKAVRLLQFVFVYMYASVVSYVVFVLSLFVPHFSFFLCFGRAVVHDGHISWVSSHIYVVLVVACRVWACPPTMDISVCKKFKFSVSLFNHTSIVCKLCLTRQASGFKFSSLSSCMTVDQTSVWGEGGGGGHWFLIHIIYLMPEILCV